jgi:glycosyltransferase involved in cell wall biosynthesis
MRENESHDSRCLPLVSVLICSYNAENFIETTVRSVVNQTYRNMEILVLDNASSDGTVGVLERLAGEDVRLKIHRGFENLGAYGGLNYLLERASGKYIAIDDHDDTWRSDKIRRQIEFLEQNAEFVGCGTAIINHYKKYGTYLLRCQPRISKIAWHTSLVFRNSGARYDAKLSLGNDFYFMKHILCRDGGHIHNSDEPCVLRTIMADRSNLSSRWINFKNLREILCVRIDALDKLALLNRLLLPERLADYLVLKVFLRRNILSEADVKEYFAFG